MKKILKISLILLVALSTIQTYAQEGDFLLYVKKGNEKEIRFSLNGIKKIHFALYDEENNLIYSENASGKTGVSRIYKLDELPVGKYFLVAQNDVKKVKYEIVVTNVFASLSKKAISEVYKVNIEKRKGVLATL